MTSRAGLISAVGGGGADLITVGDGNAVVIGDGGDFVSFAGKYVEPKRPGGWLDPGPYGCLGTGPFVVGSKRQ